MFALMTTAFLVASANASLAQGAPAVSTGPTILVATAIGQDGTRYFYEISQERANALPQWDQRSMPDPPLSMSQARRAAESWLMSRIPEVKTFEVTTLYFGKVLPGPCSGRIVDCWYYRISFDPVVGGRRLNAASEFTAVVLLDGSIVEPRSDAAQTPVRFPGATGGVPSVPIRIAGGVPPPIRTKNVNPVYPVEAQNGRVQGVVIIEATIGADGKVREAHVIRSIPLLDTAALDAVRQWEYAPTMLNGVPVPVVITVTVNFSSQ